MRRGLCADDDRGKIDVAGVSALGLGLRYAAMTSSLRARSTGPKLLSLFQLPQPVDELFRAQTDFRSGSLAEVHPVRPEAVLTSIEVPLDAAAIAALPDTVRAIATYSVGFDHVDLEAASAKGIAVFNTPGVLADAVADAALLLILGAARRATESIALLRSGDWTGWSPSQLNGVGLSGKTLGILGMGDIGQRVAARGRAFGMDIAYHNRRRSDRDDARYFDDPRGLVAASDVLLLAWPSRPETRRFINAGTLALAKPNMILVNIGRGDLVCDEDLIAALRARRILAAGLDVFDGEPRLNPGYLDLPNAFLLPHIGSSTWEARLGMAQILVDGLLAHGRGERPANRLV